MDNDRKDASILQQCQLEVHAGHDLVARFDEAVLLMRMPAPRERDTAEKIIELARGSRPGPDADSRLLLRRIAGTLAEVAPEDAPTFVVLGTAGPRLAVLLHGDVQVIVNALSGHRLSGAESTTWVDRILDAEFDQIDALIGDRASLSSVLDLDLQAGSVPGGGWSLRRRGTEVHRPPRDTAEVGTAIGQSQGGGRETAAGTAAPKPQPGLRTTAVPTATPTAEPTAEPAFESVLLTGPEAMEPEGTPLPLASTEDGVAAPAGQDTPAVEGILCSNGHFNDPSALYCRIDGISLAQRTHSYVSRPRPPLGVIVFDDGSSYTMDGDYVLGREPERDSGVVAGRVRPLVVDDDSETVSRVHAEISLDGWTVRITDRGSANGTYLALPGATIWTPIQPQHATALEPGSRVQLGSRMFVYDSYLKI